MGKVKALRRHRDEGASVPKQPLTPEEAFAEAERKVRILHANLFRRLADYDRQKDGR